MALLGVLTACQSLEIDPKLREGEGTLPKVRIAFDVALPADAASTKAMGDTPTINNMYVAVFGGNGFFNEWVPATLTKATTNYPSDTTRYHFTADLTMSDSRLRLHFIANCPEEYRDMPPITGISTQDVEDVVIAKIQSHYSASDGFNDSYWQKVILPNGIKSSPDNAAVPGNTNVLTPSAETMAQFPNPVVLVRNFARIYLVNLTDDVTIYNYGLAYAPKDGPVAPILSAPYAADKSGHLLLDGTGKPRTFDDLGDNEEFYYESFFIDYQNHPLVSDDPGVIKCTDKPYYYRGYNPGEMGGVPTDDEMLVWNPVLGNEQVPLYMYERTVPNTTQTATRVIIKAQKEGEATKYYALDINGSDGSTIPILRNNTYTVKLTGIAANTGENSAAQAAQQASANISKDTDHQEYNQISDGTSMISASYTDVIYVEPGDLTYDVYFRYIPNLKDGTGTVRNDDVEFQIGYKDESNGTFTPNGQSAKGPVFRSGSVSIASGKEYVRENNAWVEATSSSTGDRYGKISYTLVNNADYSGIVSDAGYYTESRVQCIRIIGKSTNISRDVIVRISPRKKMTVTCLNKYVVEAMGEPEVISIEIPNDLPRSMFPLDLKIEAAAKSLTPDNDELPVASGRTIVMDNSMNRLTGPSYHFVKTITREEYLAMVAATSANTVTVQAHFKTSVAHSESIVYVQNDYFEQNATSFDSFSNYFKRKFTINGFTAGDGDDVNFSFSLDTENAGKDIVWNNNANAASSSYRVLPNVVTIVLNGLQPKLKGDGSPDDDKLASLGGNSYRWTVGSLSSTPTATDANNITLHLEATAENYSVSLSTSLISPNPDLYEPATENNLPKLNISNARFEDADGNSVTSLIGLVGKEVYFRFDYDSEGGDDKLQPVTFNLIGLEPTNYDNISVNGSTFTFTPDAGSGNTQKIKLRTTVANGTTSLSSLAVSSNRYNAPSPNSFTLTRTNSFTVPSGAIYVRGSGTGNPSISTGRYGTQIYLYADSNYDTQLTNFRINGQYYSRSDVTVNLNSFSNPTGDTMVYFLYSYGNYYVTSCSLNDLINATSSSPVTLHFTRY